MPRLRKLRRKQKFQYNVNRRRLNQKSNKLPQINCDAVRQAWNEKKSVEANLTAMGLVADPNTDKNFCIPSRKQLKSKDSEKKKIPIENEEKVIETVKVLEETAKKSFVEKKAVVHPLPPEMYKKLTRFMDKYGEDFEAMSRDHGNYYQETPTQLKNQINRLKKIPQQWIPYLRSRGLITPTKTTNEEESSNTKNNDDDESSSETSDVAGTE